MRQSRGPGACGYTIPSVHLLPLPSVCLWCLLSVSSVPLGGLLAGPGLSVPRDFNSSLPPSILPLTPQVYAPPLAPPLGFYIYFLLSVFSVCTIPWGCDRGEGAGHVGITSVYVPPARLPPTGLWPPLPAHPPSGESCPFGLHPFFADNTPSLPVETCPPVFCSLCAPHVPCGVALLHPSSPSPPPPLSLQSPAFQES